MADDRGADVPAGTEAGVLADRLKERIYATITMIAVVVGLSLGDVGSLGAVATVLTTALGLWLAALVADQQAHRTVHRHLATGRELRRMLYVSSPLLSCAVGPAVLIALAALDVLSLDAALMTAAGVGVFSLFLWGCVGGLRMGGGAVAATVAGLVDAAIGVAVALVKAAAGH
ncbi:hypothetical protein GCM10010103_60370 [Streptomyces paradoxus]|uniref:Uncharacterized protein n=1 Tax=Streptomyces paradoxus TaxID=66375 RepID=A0A7W9TIL7_9ACTN|nr:hypothetical protein [Streptomyces paradoxus]MBB6080292.1 hypothetical protein [Streptomyces paradoxus]